MDAILHFFHWLIALIRDPGPLMEWGYVGVAVIVFIETGALAFFLPGDSLLVMAGLYAARGGFHIGLLILLLLPCAIAGDSCAYFIGARTGPRLFSRPRSRFFRPEHLHAAHRFYEKHGGKAIVLARFMPLVRTFVPVVAGMVKVPYRRFVLFNVIGDALWVLSMTLIGYVLGVRFPILVRHIEKVIVVIVLLSITPGLIEYARHRRRKRLESQSPEAERPRETP
jgi:membrane-associated protein